MMKSESKLITVALISCALVLAFTACAGCTDSSASSSDVDKIVGTYSLADSNGDMMMLDLNSDHTTDLTTIFYNGSVQTTRYDPNKGPLYWKNIGDNAYTIEDQISLTFDGNNKLEYTLLNGESYTLTKYIPSNQGTDAIVGKWYDDEGPYYMGLYYNFNPDGTVIGTFEWRSENVKTHTNYEVTSNTLKWKKIGDNCYQLDTEGDVYGTEYCYMNSDGTKLIGIDLRSINRGEITSDKIVKTGIYEKNNAIVIPTPCAPTVVKRN